MTSEDVQTNLRLPADLKERVLKAAAQNKRSLSAEVAARLEATFEAAALVKGIDIVKELEFVRHTYERQINAATLGQEMLAHWLIAAADALPDDVKNAHYFSHALAFAHGVMEKDGDKILKGYAGLIPELQEAPVIKELEEVNAKHKRGEDIRPDLQRHLDDTRRKWEAQQNISEKANDH